MAEEKETKSGSKYHIDQENFKKSIILGCIVLGITTLHVILSLFVSGNLPWFIINAVCFAGELVMGIYGLKYFFSTTKALLNKDLATFIISICVFAFAFSFALWFFCDSIGNLIGLLKN